MILGFAVLIFLFHTVPAPQSSTLKSRGFINSIREVFGPVWLPIVLIWLAMTLRAYVSQSFMTYLPIMVARQGYSLLSIGTLVSLFSIAGALSGVFAGHLSDRIGFRPVFFTSLILTTPCMIAALYQTGCWIFIFGFLSGFFYSGPPSIGRCAGTKAGPPGQIHGLQPDDGACLWYGRVVYPLDREARGYI